MYCDERRLQALACRLYALDPTRVPQDLQTDRVMESRKLQPDALLGKLLSH